MSNCLEKAAQHILWTAKNTNVEAVLLFGPTAVGKTDLLETLADKPIEVISADSRQVYRGFEISTAYPCAEIRARIPHHLIDILHFTQIYTVASFIKRACACIAEIRSRGNIPIVSGGTAYYLYHLCYGMPTTPPAHVALRKCLEAQAKERGLPDLYERLYSLDPVYARSIASTDMHRIVRALEIIELTNRTLKTFQPQARQKRDNYAVFGLTRDRATLHKRITQRIDAMYAQGLVREVYTLYKNGLRLVNNAAHTIGVQEFLQDAQVTKMWDCGVCELPFVLWQECLRPKIIARTRQYAKRQIAFFKRFSNTQSLVLNDELHVTTSD